MTTNEAIKFALTIVPPLIGTPLGIVCARKGVHVLVALGGMFIFSTACIIIKHMI